MNERHLCRGKRTDNGKWVVGLLSPIRNYEGGEWYVGIAETGGISYTHLQNFHYRKVDPATVGQCTGLRDKNGKLIFEGDIFELRDSCQFEVVWDVECARYIGTRIKASPERMICYVGMCDKNGKSVVEIIGNIHDNSELMEGAK